MTTKEELQKQLDKLRRDSRSFRKGTEQYEARIRLEQQLDMGLYDKTET